MMHKPVIGALEPKLYGENCDPAYERLMCGHMSCLNSKCGFCTFDSDCHSPRHRCFNFDNNIRTACVPGNKGCTCHHKTFFLSLIHI